MTDATVQAVLADLAAIEDPRMRAVNERHGDDHGANLTKLRGVAKSLKTDHPLALELWSTGDTAARLVALLICRPRSFSADELDRMLREARAPKVRDWLLNHVVKKTAHVEELRLKWFDDDDPVVAGAGWALTADGVAKHSDRLDVQALLGTIQTQMPTAPDPLQWSMNATLAAIGIHHDDLRAEAIEIGERLEVLKDYPTSPGCTSPYAPIWISEMVRRRPA